MRAQNSGFSIIELMIGLLMMGGLMLVQQQLTKDVLQTSQGAKQVSGWSESMRLAGGVLANNNAACVASFQRDASGANIVLNNAGGPQTFNLPGLLPRSGASPILQVVGAGSEVEGLRISQMTLTTVPQQTWARRFNATLDIQAQQVGGTENGKALNRSFRFFIVTDLAGRVTDCLGGFSNQEVCENAGGLWDETRTPKCALGWDGTAWGMALSDPAYNVGIGTSTPQFKIDVRGSAGMEGRSAMTGVLVSPAGAAPTPVNTGTIWLNP